MIFTGSGVALCTPFSDSGINFDTFEKLIEFQIAGGTDMLLVCGTTGEPSTMSCDEKHAAIEFAVKTVNGRIPVCAGVGGNNTADVVACAQHAKEAGADSLLVVTPYYNKCTPKGIKGHFFAVADAVDLPIIVYNVPARTGVNIPPAVFGELCEHKNIAGIKEASGNISHIAEVAHATRGKAELYSGNDDHIVPVLSLGGVGVISVLANIMPKYTHDMVAAFLNGDAKKACDMQLNVNKLLGALFSEVNPIPVKSALRLMGFDMGEFRLPLTEMEEAHHANLAAQMKEFDLI